MSNLRLCRLTRGMRPLSPYLLLLLAVGLACRLLVLFGLPPNGGSDEIAHREYAHRLAARPFELPVAETRFPGYTVETKRELAWVELNDFSPRHDWECFQPPLYYALLALGPAHLYAERAWGILFWLLAIVLVLRSPLPDRHRLLIVAVFSCLPTAIHVGGTVTNDALLLPAAAVLLFGSRRNPWLFGLTLAAALYTKQNMLLAVAVTLALARWRSHWPGLLKACALAAVLYLPWLLFYGHQYGGLSVGAALWNPVEWQSLGNMLKSTQNVWDTIWTTGGYRNRAVVPPFTWLASAAATITLWRYHQRFGWERWFSALLLAAGAGFLASLWLHYKYDMGSGRYLLPLLPLFAWIVAETWEDHPHPVLWGLAAFALVHTTFALWVSNDFHLFL